MLKLSSKENVVHQPMSSADVLIARVTKRASYPSALRFQTALLVENSAAEIPTGFAAVLFRPNVPVRESGTPSITLAPSFSFLDEGDVIRIAPPQLVSTIFRRNARTNSLLVTERCNSFCVMCSQPPKKADDSFLVDELLRAIPLFDRDCREIGITGGEPTLLGDRLFELIAALKAYLPDTAVHILSNGRLFSDLALAAKLASLSHRDLMVGVPLYSDTASLHDFVVQADGAFDETVRGILNLKRCSVRVEIRIVIHAATYRRLPMLAEFIARNLQFVDHVALMGLELMGFARSNLDALWIDPVDYQRELSAAVGVLNRARLRVSIYNHQLCILEPTLRRYAVRSISDWKNEYLEECAGCDLRQECGGFFSSSSLRRSAHIRALHRSGAASPGLEIPAVPG